MRAPPFFFAKLLSNTMAQEITLPVPFNVHIKNFEKIDNFIQLDQGVLTTLWLD